MRLIREPAPDSLIAGVTRACRVRLLEHESALQKLYSSIPKLFQKVLALFLALVFTLIVWRLLWMG